MLNQCANPACARPLVYLREGRIFVFEVPSTNGANGEKRTRHLEHFWLCGKCARTMRLVQNGAAVEVIRKHHHETYLTTNSVRWGGSELILPGLRRVDEA
ncbi:MAG TPA: hypothetical protein VJS11_07860 [Acidobacteriaceae bacterium]|nr:hypothetical protein [Acidobacteriaceae bacterium]